MEENARTPSNPHASPALGNDSAADFIGIALPCCFMTTDSSSRIVTALREWIAGAPAGSKLPSTRSLVTRYEASPVTVQKALRILTGQGLSESRPGVGTFVRAVRTVKPSDLGWQTGALGAPRNRVVPAPAAMRVAPVDAFALHSGYPDRELLPERLIRAALARAGRSDAALTRSPIAGLPELQSWFAAELAAAHRVTLLLGSDPRRSTSRRPPRPCRIRTRGSRPGGRRPRVRGNRSPGVLRPTELREPDRNPMVGCDHI
ncbi:hypothetical protein H4V95_002257 [Arthrobacter sp. CAN_C5]|nr:hypothetical protein [Arthrobacter sp. CAN_C5]